MKKIKTVAIISSGKGAESFTGSAPFFCYMTCGELLKNQKLKSGLKLIAGKEGLIRNISWIYFADSVECIKENYNVADFINGQEFVVVTNSSLTGSDEVMIKLLKEWNTKEISGIAVNEGQISPAVIDYCNSKDLPLFELSVNLHAVDLSQILCHGLIQEETSISSIERLFVTILTEEHLNVESVLEQASYLGVHLSGKFQVADFCLSEKSLKKAAEFSLVEIFNDLNKTLLNELRFLTNERLMVVEMTEDVVLLLPEELSKSGKLETAVRRCIQRMKLRYGFDLICGAGERYEYLEDFRKSWREAKSAARIAELMTEKQDVYYYEKLGIYSVILQISNGKFIDGFIESRIGKLIEADKIQNGELCKSLEKYIECDCNALVTAEELNVHRNTMNYRLNKIRSILEDNLDSVNSIMEYKLAFAMMHMRLCTKHN